MKPGTPLIALVLLLTPALSRACAVCFGADGGNAALGQAFNIAVTITLGVTMGLIATGIAWFRRLEAGRKARDAEYIAGLDHAGPQDSGWTGPASAPSR